METVLNPPPPGQPEFSAVDVRSSAGPTRSTGTNALSAHGVGRPPNPAVLALHRQLPDYAPTPLHSLPGLAEELGLGHVLLKDESDRCGLPSFKILGASWAVYRALVAALRGQPADAATRIPSPQEATTMSLTALADTVRLHNSRARSPTTKGTTAPLQIVSTTEGNWGRAVARMARIAGDVPCRLHVPWFMPEDTQQLLRGEGADVRVVEAATYDDCVAVAREDARRTGALLVLDVGWEGYEEIPNASIFFWVIQGYSTMLAETDAQVYAATGGRTATHVVVPVGAGSIAQAVTEHYKGGRPTRDVMPEEHRQAADTTADDTAIRKKSVESRHPRPHLDHRPDSSRTRVLTAEPDTAACLRASLAAGRRTTVATAITIMAGLNCGTLSETAWPVLRAGVDYSVAVSDRQAHVAVQQLRYAETQAARASREAREAREARHAAASEKRESGSDGGDEAEEERRSRERAIHAANMPGEGGDPGFSGYTGRSNSNVDGNGNGNDGVLAGPCGAATLAALRKICGEARDIVELDQESVVVLFCTEGPRPYDVPSV